MSRVMPGAHAVSRPGVLSRAASSLWETLRAWRARRSPTLIGWACVGLFALFSALMLLWQVRAGPAAQLLAVPGATPPGTWSVSGKVSALLTFVISATTFCAWSIGI